MPPERTRSTRPTLKLSSLRRAEGHLRSIIEMIEMQRSCLDVGQHLHAVEKAIAQAKKTLIHDHIEDCLEQAVGLWRGHSGTRSMNYKVSLNIAGHGPADRTAAIGPGAGWVLLPSALVLGVLHGLEPGHSTTMMADFVIAVRGSVVQAVLLGFAATVSRTFVIWL